MWLRSYENTVKESTLNKTEQVFRIHILPELGNRFIDAIKISHCQKAVDKWFMALKNYRVVNSYTGLVFHHAMKLGIIKDNPTKLVTMPVRVSKAGEENKKLHFYTKEELRAFLDGVDDPKWSTYFRILAYTGCRKSEALALTWNDVDFSRGTVNINKTLANGMNNELIVQSPKTRESRRVISLDKGTLDKLKEWKGIQAEQFKVFGFKPDPKDPIVFQSAKNTYINPQKIGQSIRRYCDKNGLRFIPAHGFRHTHCSLLFESGASLKEVQDRLGHADIQTTMNIYTHVTEQKKEETADKFAEYLEG